MHASELVDLAALVAENSRPLISATAHIADECLQSYWTSSRCRLDHWGRGLRAAADLDSPHDTRYSEACQLWEEILVSEILSRTIVALLAAHDDRHGHEEAASIALNTLYGHVDARRRALRQIDMMEARYANSAKSYRQLFASVKRWNDLLLALTPHSELWVELAFSRQLARDFSADAAVHSRTEQAVTVKLVRSSLSFAFRPRIRSGGYSAELNLRLAAAVIELFGPELFDSFGLLKSTWLHRLESTTEEASAMMARLIGTRSKSIRWQR